MAQGLQIFDSTGAIQLDITDHIARITGTTPPTLAAGETQWRFSVPKDMTDPSQAFNVQIYYGKY